MDIKIIIVKLELVPLLDGCTHGIIGAINILENNFKIKKTLSDRWIKFKMRKLRI